MYCDIKIKYYIKKVVVFFFIVVLVGYVGNFLEGFILLGKKLLLRKIFFFFYLFSNYKLLYIFRKEDIVLVFYINIE